MRGATRLSAIVIALLMTGCGGAPQEETPVDPEVAAAFEEMNPKVYTRLDPIILGSIPDDSLEQAVLDYALLQLEGNEQNEADIVHSLAPGVRNLYLTWTVQVEVSDGGFDQYYLSTGGRFADEAVAAFEYFGAAEHAALMREANALRASGSATLATLNERFPDLSENLSQLRIARIRQDPEQFSGN
jgi:hypothetical protein